MAAFKRRPMLSDFPKAVPSKVVGIERFWCPLQCGRFFDSQCRFGSIYIGNNSDIHQHGCVFCLRECGTQNLFKFMFQQKRRMLPIVKLQQAKNGNMKFSNAVEFARYKLDIHDEKILKAIEKEEENENM